MTKWSLPEADDALSLGRVILAGLGGHCLASFAFIFTYMVCLLFRKLSLKGISAFATESWSEFFMNIILFICLPVLLALPGAIVISPSLLVTLPITLFAAAFLKTGKLPAIALGAPVGILVAMSLSLFRGRQNEWIMVVSSAAGGAAFAWFVWLTCIHPFRRRLPVDRGNS